jgi:hypothetical protein
MSFHPYPTRGGFISLAIAIIAGGISLTLANFLLQQNQPFAIFKFIIGLLIALGLTAIALHWTLIAFKLGYHLNRNGLGIQWGLGQQRIPFRAIETIVPGETVSPLPHFRGVNLGGLRFGWSKSAEYGSLKFRATAPLTQSLLIVTADEAYVISPNRPDSFLKAWQTRQGLGPTQQWTMQVHRQWPLNIRLLVDPLTWWLVAGSALLGLALFGYIALRYPELPQALPVHFDSLGRADRIANKVTLFILSAAGAIVWSMNAILGGLIYRREKVAAYLLWGVAIVVQLCLWVAVLTITSNGN